MPLPPPLPAGHPPHPPPPQPQQQQGVILGSGAKRKKWTEKEERSLIEKYEEMMREGALTPLKTREKRFRPIAAHVNAAHHAVDQVAFPFQWSWKDASTKVQNMRHQYLLVKQKLVFSAAGSAEGSEDQKDLIWEDGLSLWPNFLLYKQVFGDVPLPSPGAADVHAPSPAAVPGAGLPSGSFDGGEIGINDVRNLGLGFDCDADDGDEEGFDYEEVAVAPQPPSIPAEPPVQLTTVRRKKRRKKVEGQAWAFVESQVARLKEREALLEEREANQDRERRQRREQARVELEEWEQLRCRRRRELDEEWEEKWRQRQEDERRWEERMERRRLEWKKSMEGMLNQHRVEMEQLQARVLHVQQGMINQILGLVAQWPGPSLHSGGLSDGTGFANPHNQHHQVYASQLIQNMHHVSGIVHGDNRVGGESQDDQFIVDDG